MDNIVIKKPQYLLLIVSIYYRNIPILLEIFYQSEFSDLDGFIYGRS